MDDDAYSVFNSNPSGPKDLDEAYSVFGDEPQQPAEESNANSVFDFPETQEPEPVDEEATSLWGHVVAGFHQSTLASDVSRTAKNLRQRDELLSGEAMTDGQQRMADVLDTEINRTLATFKRRQRAMRERPMSKEAEDLLKGDDIWGAIKRGNFGLIGELTARSAAPSLKSGIMALGGGLVGGIAGGPIGAVAGAGIGAAAGSGDTEFDHHVLQAMQESGVDIHDRESLEKMVRDDEAMAEIYSDALIRGGIVGSVDGIAQMTAFLRLVPKGIKNKVIKGLTEGLTQVALQGCSGWLW